MNASSKFTRALAEFLADPKGLKLEHYHDSQRPHSDHDDVSLWAQWKAMRDELGVAPYATADQIEMKL